MIDKKKKKYLIAGGVNTLFGYGIGVCSYELLDEYFNVFFIGVVAYFVAITFSFVVYKIFVFKTVGNWISEYVRAHLVYGVVGLLGAMFLWFFVDVLNISIWIAQGLNVVCAAVISFVGHNKITFKP